MASRSSIQDTNPEAELVLIELIRAMPDWKKMEQVGALIRTARRLATEGLRNRYPDSSEDELRRRLAALVLDRETVIRVYGWDPDVEGY